jgi:regulator of replication initiation timing
MKKGYVYHIIDPNFPESLEHGYIGVTVEHRGPLERFKEHKNSKKYMRSIIKENNLNFENHVKILCFASLDYCYYIEKKLRPKQLMGWNVAAGGGGFAYKSMIDDLKKFRSKLQTERMKNEELKKKQAESFKENYYSDLELQKLRKQRAIEHMSDPVKKEKCLSAMHKKVKCSHCDYENNPGNVAIHLKKKHGENK